MFGLGRKTIRIEEWHPVFADDDYQKLVEADERIDRDWGEEEEDEEEEDEEEEDEEEE